MPETILLDLEAALARLDELELRLPAFYVSRAIECLQEILDESGFRDGEGI